MSKWKEVSASGRERLFAWLRRHRRRIVELGKTCLIIILFCSACFLADRSGILGQGGFSTVRENVTAWLRGGESGPAVMSGREYATAAKPQVMAVSPDDGVHYGAAFTSEVDELYERFSAFLGEALGTSEQIIQLTTEQWLAALSRRGIYFDFAVPQRLDCLAAWQQTSVPWDTENICARRLFLSVEEQDVRLYFAVEGSGAAYCCDTEVEAGALSTRMERYQSNGAYFAFEREETDRLDADVLIVPAVDTVRGVSGTAVSFVGRTETVLQQFGMNTVTATSYQEASGTAVYLDGYSTLRIQQDGLITYEREPGQDLPEFDLRGTVSLPELADRLYSLTMELSGNGGDCAQLRLLQADYDLQNDRYTVSFAYFIDGMQVCCGLGPAAEFTFAGGTLTQAALCLRQYEFTGETQTPLPAVQAAALVSASGGTDPVRVYQDMGDRVTVSWKMG